MMGTFNLNIKILRHAFFHLWSPGNNAPSILHSDVCALRFCPPPPVKLCIEILPHILHFLGTSVFLVILLWQLHSCISCQNHNYCINLKATRHQKRSNMCTPRKSGNPFGAPTMQSTVYTAVINILKYAYHPGSTIITFILRPLGHKMCQFW